MRLRTAVAATLFAIAALISTPSASVAADSSSSDPKASARTMQAWGRLQNDATGKCMNIPGGDTSWGAPITQFTCGTWRDHYWTWEWREGDFFWIRNQASGLCLAVPGGTTERDVQLIQWPCDPRFEDHLWRFQEYPQGDQIINKHSGQCVAVRAGNGADNAPVIQFPCGSWRDHFWDYVE